MMNRGFWDKLPSPFFALAPMADVTDCVFRRVVAERGKPDVLFTEFVSADGLAHPVARERLLLDLQFSSIERPVVAQIFGSRPENIKKAAVLCRELGFDGLDVNMGCPERNVCKQGAGAELIRRPILAREIIDAAKEGAEHLPVSVKTRMGYSSLDEFKEWFKVLLNCDLAAITVHLRTKKEMSKVPAHWELAGELRRMQIANHWPEREADSDRRRGCAAPSARGAGLSDPESVSRAGPLLIANGDVSDLADARQKAERYDLDGVMLGRAIFGNPWLFANSAHLRASQEVFSTIIYHSELFEKTYCAPRSLGGVGKNFAIMKKFFGAYVAGHPKAHEIKLALMNCDTAADVAALLAKFS